MKARIVISGQISGNHTIREKLHGYTKCEKTHFNGFVLYYNTVGDAIKDLRQCWRNLKLDDCNGKMDYITRDGKCLNYDESKATVVTT